MLFPHVGSTKESKGKKSKPFPFFMLPNICPVMRSLWILFIHLICGLPYHGTIKSHNWNVISWSSYKPLNYKGYTYYKKPMGFSQGWRPREISSVKCGLEYFLLLRSKSKCITYKVNLSAESVECKLLK